MYHLPQHKGIWNQIVNTDSEYKEEYQEFKFQTKGEQQMPVDVSRY